MKHLTACFFIALAAVASAHAAPKPVTVFILAGQSNMEGAGQIKADPKLKDMVLVKNSRLSVQPVSKAEFKHICKLGGVKA